MRSNVGGKGERERRESKREGGKVEYIGFVTPFVNGI